MDNRPPCALCSSGADTSVAFSLKKSENRRWPLTSGQHRGRSHGTVELKRGSITIPSWPDASGGRSPKAACLHCGLGLGLERFMGRYYPYDAISRSPWLSTRSSFATISISAPCRANHNDDNVFSGCGVRSSPLVSATDEILTMWLQTAFEAERHSVVSIISITAAEKR